MRNFKIFIMFVMTLVMSCGSDDAETEMTVPTNVVISFADSSFQLTTDFANGTIIGTVTATTNFGTITYAIASQDPAGAIAINASSGELSIANADALNERAGTQLILEISATTAGEVTEISSVTINVPEIVDENCGANFFIGMLSSRGKILEDGIVVDNIPEITLEGAATSCNTLRITTAALFDFDCDEPITITVEFEPLIGGATTGMLTVTEMEIPCFTGEAPTPFAASGSYDITTSVIELSIVEDGDDTVIYQRFIAGPDGQLPEDPDIDNDGILNDVDNCPENSNADQQDIDNDGIGDTCDDDSDGDGIINSEDNCPDAPNPDQADADMDGLGDVCDDFNNNDCVPTVETSIWEGDLNSDRSGFQVPITAVAGCNTLTITGDFTDNFCELMAEVTLTFTPESEGATRGTVTLSPQDHPCLPESPGEIVEGSGTYDEPSQTIFLSFEIMLDGEIIDEAQVTITLR